MDPLVLSLLQSTIADANPPHILPSLTKVQISVPGWDSLTTMLSLSSKLRQLTLDLGFNKARTDAKGWSNDAVAAKYLKQVASVASIQQLELRGLALGSHGINSALISMTSLRVLCLTTGNSLSAETFAAIAAFPCLGELEVHAGHLDADELADLMQSHEAQLFPALQKLRIRAQAPLLRLVLQIMPTDHLKSLFVEAEQPVQPPSSWASALALIPVRASDTLRELTIEHHIDIDVQETDSHLTDTAAHSDSLTSDTQFTLASLRPLAKLPYLRRFILDTTLPPDLCDVDVDEITRWWPIIESLDLGGLMAPVDCHERIWKPRATLRCLDSFANHCPQLASLVINIDTDTENFARNGSKTLQSCLHNLTLGTSSAPEPLLLAQYLCQMFPALLEVDGVAAHEEEWRAVQSYLHGVHSQGP